MPYALLGSLRPTRLDLASQITIADGEDFEFDFVLKQTSNSVVCRVATLNNSTAQLAFAGGLNAVQILTGGTNRNLTVPVADRTEYFRIQLTRSGTLLTVYYNGVITGTNNFGSGAVSFNRLLETAFASDQSNTVQYIKLTKASGNHHWLNTTGTGTVWTDIVGGNNATQVGTWPAGDAEWIFYDDGGATESTISYDLGAFGFAVESTVTAPAVTASADYDIGALGFAVSANVTAPTATASAAYDLGAFGFSASATASVPIVQSAIDYSIGDFGFAVIADATSENNTASISYDLGAFGFAVDAASTVPVVSVSTAYDLGAFGFSVVADIATAPTASVLYDLGGFGFAASAQVIPPPIEAVTAYDLGSFGFSVFATQPTGLRPQAGATLKFTELSRKVAAIELSRSVRYTELSRKVRG